MCRIFAFRAQNKSQVHHSLVETDNALMRQSKDHPDGWGIAYYSYGVPHVIKSLGAAEGNEVFHQISRSLFSDTVVAHIRRRTQGDISIVNCHPFQVGRWVMAHNGDLPAFKLIRSELIKDIHPEFLANILGSTDSEIYFALLMNELKNLGISADPAPPIKLVAQAVRTCIDKIERVAKHFEVKEVPSLNIALSNGAMLLAYRQGRELNFSSYQTTEASSCTSALSPGTCVNKLAGEGQKISHLLVSSEPLMQDKVWQPLGERQIIAVDHEWRLWRDL